MIRRPPRSTLSSSSAASDVYKRQVHRRRVSAPPGPGGPGARTRVLPAGTDAGHVPTDVHRPGKPVPLDDRVGSAGGRNGVSAPTSLDGGAVSRGLALRVIPPVRVPAARHQKDFLERRAPGRLAQLTREYDQLCTQAVDPFEIAAGRVAISVWRASSNWPKRCTTSCRNVRHRSSPPSTPGVVIRPGTSCGDCSTVCRACCSSSPCGSSRSGSPPRCWWPRRSLPARSVSWCPSSGTCCWVAVTGGPHVL